MPRKPSLTDAQAAQLRADRDAGMTWDAIADKYGLSVAGARYWGGCLNGKPAPRTEPVDWRKNIDPMMWRSPTFMRMLADWGLGDAGPTA